MEQLKQTVLKEFPRLTENDTFTFQCHSGLKCFNNCCGDVSIVLSPYDILMMRKALNISSDEFLGRYTFVPFNQDQRLPIVFLKMDGNEGKRCPFVTEKGCSIYSSRPWACRMYPLGMASPKSAQEQGEPFYFIMKERPCDGFEEKRSQTISDWLEDQGIVEYNRFGEEFKNLTLHDFFIKGNSLDPKKMEMFYMACYDVDRFRRFIFESTFLDNFNVDAKIIESIRGDDIAMMQFAFRWLNFCLFGEPTMTIKKRKGLRSKA